MPAEMGWQRYSNFRKELTWGTRDAAGSDIYIPLSGQSITTTVQSVQADLFTGLRQRVHNRVLRATCGGQISLPLFGVHVASKSIAQHLIEWATNGPATPFLDSFTIDIADANENKRYLGARVGSMTISGDADSGIVSATFDVQAQSEAAPGAITAVSATAPSPVEFAFSDVKFYLSTDAEAEDATATNEEVPIRGFSLTFNNNLVVKHTNSFFPTQIVAGVRSVALQIQIFKESAFYDGLRRASTVTRRGGRLVIKGQHLGTTTGTFTTVEFLFDRLNFANAVDAYNLNDLTTQAVDWIALKPATTEPELEIIYGTE